MKIEAPFVAVDWGTTSLRAMLCESPASDFNPGLVVTGPGIKQLQMSVADTLFAAIEPWVAEHGQLDLLLAGMVGSNLGWREAPYLSCPLDARRIGQGLLNFEERGHRVAIVPGVSCINALGQPDVMRGEETQILGWVSRNGNALKGGRLLCLPGTHTKWVQLVDGELKRFTTSLTGELFSILKAHSVLVSPQEATTLSDFHVESFRQGVEVAIEHSADMLHAIFSTRARGLINKDEFFDAASYLSGLLIGFDVQSALKTYDDSNGIVELIGAGDLSEKFSMAIEQMGYKSRISEGNQTVFAGLLAIASGSQE